MRAGQRKEDDVHGHRELLDAVDELLAELAEVRDDKARRNEDEDRIEVQLRRDERRQVDDARDEEDQLASDEAQIERHHAAEKDAREDRSADLDGEGHHDGPLRRLAHRLRREGREDAEEDDDKDILQNDAAHDGLGHGPLGAGLVDDRDGGRGRGREADSADG